MICTIAGHENSWNFGFYHTSITRDQVTIGIQIEDAVKGLGVGQVSDCNEDAFAINFYRIFALEVFYFDCSDPTIFIR